MLKEMVLQLYISLRPLPVIAAVYLTLLYIIRGGKKKRKEKRGRYGVRGSHAFPRDKKSFFSFFHEQLRSLRTFANASNNRKTVALNLVSLVPRNPTKERADIFSID